MEDDDLPAADSVDVDAVANEDSFDHFVKQLRVTEENDKSKRLGSLQEAVGRT